VEKVTFRLGYFEFEGLLGLLSEAFQAEEEKLGFSFGSGHI